MIFGMNVANAVTGEVLHKTHYWELGGLIAAASALFSLLILGVIFFEREDRSDLKTLMAFSIAALALAGAALFSFAQSNSISEDSNQKLTEALNSKYGLTVDAELVNGIQIKTNSVHEAVDSSGNRIMFKFTLNKDNTEIYAYTQANEVEVVKSPAN